MYGRGNCQRELTAVLILSDGRKDVKLEHLQVTIEFDELRELRDKLERADKCLDRIYNIIMTQSGEDSHGNVGSRQRWLEAIFNETRTALGEAGYAVYTAPFALPIMPGLTAEGEADIEGIQMPDFVRDRA